MNKNLERRAYTAKVEIRSEGDSKPTIVGYAAVFNSLSEEMWGFREIIRPGAFANAIKKDDIRALWNHNPDYVLGRNKSGTLNLSEDERGLRIEITPPDTQWAKDLMESMRRGDVDQMSFGFIAVKEQWSGSADHPIRELLECDLFDVSPVTFPAYPATSVGVRSMQDVYNAHTAEVQANQAEQARQQARVSLLRKQVDLAEKSI